MYNEDLQNTGLPEFPNPYWLESIQVPDFPQLDRDIEADIAIVGGGITGLTSAYILVNKGFKVALLEADKLLHGTTGHTTAKVTAQHGLIYDEFIQNFGLDKASLYYEANIKALNFIEETIKKHKIDCDFSKQDSYIYATSIENAVKLEKEAKAYEKIGITSEYVRDIPLPIEIENALIMKDQAQFNPAKYLATLIKIIKEKGGLIFEKTTAVNIETGASPTVLTKDEYRVKSKHVLVCTHFPFYEGTGLYSARMHAERSYVLAAKIKESFPSGMYLSADKPTRSLRSVKVHGEDMILIVGEDHKTGQGIDTLEHYKALEQFGRNTFSLESIPYRWSAQDLVTVDKIPYIGGITASEPNILIAAGYRKWGMTNGTVAALIFGEYLLDKDGKIHDLFSPSRFHADPSLKNLLVQNANVAGQLIKGKLDFPNKSVEDLSNDQASIVTIKGERKGAYRDKEGKTHIVDTTCTHMGCEVEWNSGDRTWDCPCHGSRFSFTGDVIEGPAEKPLQKYDYHMIDNLTSEDSGY